MDLFENNNFKKEKVTFDCSIKNSKKNASYKNLKIYSKVIHVGK